MNSLSSSTSEVQAVGGELLDGSGFEAEDPVTDFGSSEFPTAGGSEQ